METSNLAGPAIGLGHHVIFGAEGQTDLNPLVASALVAAILLILLLPRTYVVVPFLFLALLLPLGQKLMLGPLNVHCFRILLLAGWLRLVWQRYMREGSLSMMRVNPVDKAVVCYALSHFVCYVLLWQSLGAFIGDLGLVYNVLGCYFLFRFFIRTPVDVDRMIRTLAVVSAIIAAFMCCEQVTGRNLFAVLGGVPEFTPVRAGYVRSQGPFEVYLTAGAFGATLLPLFLSMWHKSASRLFSALGLIGALTIAITSKTSTAISAVLAAIVGILMWPCRRRMRLVRGLILTALVTIHLCMKAPVWALLARVDIVGGSTGWHRFKIVDNLVRYFWDWWLIGSNNYWTWDGGDDMWDLANQYVAIGASAGLFPLLSFLAAIVFCFKYLGAARNLAAADQLREWKLWLLGTTLFSNLVVFFGISYFDQSQIYWYALLAIIVASATSDLQTPSRLPFHVAIESSTPLEESGERCMYST